MSLPERKLAQITEYLPAALLIGRRIPDATVALDVALEGSVARPSGTVDLDVHVSLLPGSDALSPPIDSTENRNTKAIEAKPLKRARKTSGTTVSP